ncbi:MAG: D-alanyl-D-alanine carboxypeptidase [Oscillospiraceae bacterium]|nr:D-alanyl-D-alanine carboxypeptidase [Oscillospiraceae bacterium]
MKKYKLLRRILMIVVVFAVLTSYVFATETEEPLQESASVSGCYSMDATQHLIGPELRIDNAKAAFLYETSSQTLMYALNPDVQLPPSSLVKIMTALLVTESGNLTDVITVQQSTLDSIPIGAMDADLQAGEIMPLGDLLYCMMVGSANDAAAVMAEHIAGSQSAFVSMMNTRAAELGCTATTFINVHGLHNDQQLTTARDVAKILSAAMENELFHAVFSTDSYTVPATNLSEERSLATSNYLQNKPPYYDERVTGGRTGTANDGTRCLAATAGKDGMNLVSVIMGAESEIDEKTSGIKVYGGFNETKQLFDAGFTGYKPAQILFEGQVLTQRDVTDGENKVSIGPKVSVSTVLPAQVSSQDLTFRYEDGGSSTKAPVQTGDRITGVEIWYGDLCVAKTDLYALNDVRVGNSFTTGDNQYSGSGLLKTVLVIVGALVCFCILVLLTIRLSAKLRSYSARKRSKRRRRSRRRS